MPVHFDCVALRLISGSTWLRIVCPFAEANSLRQSLLLLFNHLVKLMSERERQSSESPAPANKAVRVREVSAVKSARRPPGPLAARRASSTPVGRCFSSRWPLVLTCAKLGGGDGECYRVCELGAWLCCCRLLAGWRARGTATGRPPNALLLLSWSRRSRGSGWQDDCVSRRLTRVEIGDDSSCRWLVFSLFSTP